jgi:hypothetical protein
VNFYVVQVLIRLCLATILCARALRVCRVRASRPAHPTSALPSTTQTDTAWFMRSDMLSLDIDKVPHLHDLLVSLPCAPLGIAGGGVWSSSLGYLPAPYLHKGGSLYNTRLPHLHQT